MSEQSSKPQSPDLPACILDPLENQSADQLEIIATYTRDLAAWKRGERERDRRDRREQSNQYKEVLDERGISTDPIDYTDSDDVTGPPAGAYITIKETKPGYHYYYWQWRVGETWKNAYIAPVSPSE